MCACVCWTPLTGPDTLYLALQLLDIGEVFKHQAEASCRCVVCELAAGAGPVHLYCQTSLTLQSGLQIRASVFGVGAPEALVVGVVALVVFGPRGLAEVSSAVCQTRLWHLGCSCILIN